MSDESGPRHDVLASLLHEHMLVSRHAATGAAPHGRRPEIDRSAALLLTLLRLNGPMTVAQIAEACDLDVSTIHRQLVAAKRAGLVETVRDPEGGAAKVHRPTADGLASLDTEMAARRKGVARVLAAWSDDDVHALATLLRRFNESLEAVRGHPWPRP